MDLLDLYASLTLDSTKYERALANAENKGKAGADRIGTSMASAASKVASGVKSAADSVVSGVGKMASLAADGASKVANAFATVGKVTSGVMVAGMSVASAATVKLGKDALDAYGDYEQLAGGIDTLFGEGSTASAALRKFADDAWQNVQMSANDYMATVTDFSATLLQSLDPDAAADKANQALTQMADNANKMGSSIETVRDAYRGLAKDNATMLDNLKLGYGGNQGELARLLNDSGVLGDVVADEKNVWDVASFDQIIDAIGVIQKRLGMAGASQEEALHTIQGSINATKAAWKNLLTGFANPDADLDKLVASLGTALDAAQDNILPAVTRTLNAAGDVITKSAPKFGARLTSLVRDVSPTLLKSAASLMVTVGDVIIDTAPDLVEQTLTAIETALDGVSVDDLASRAANAVLDIISSLARRAPQFVTAIGDVVVTVINTALRRIEEDPQGFARDVGEILSAIVGVAGRLVFEVGPQLGDALMSLFGLGFGAVDASSLGENARGLLSRVLASGDAINGAIEAAATVASSFTGEVGRLISTFSPELGASVAGLFDGVTDLSPESLANLATNILNALCTSMGVIVEEGLPALFDFVDRFVAQFTSEENLAKLQQGGQNLLNGIASGISNVAESGDVENIRHNVVSAVTTFVGWITDGEQIEKMTGAGIDLLHGLANGLDGDVESIVKAARQAVTTLVTTLNDNWTIAQLIDAGVDIARNILVGLINGFSDLLPKFAAWVAEQSPLTESLAPVFRQMEMPHLEGVEGGQTFKDFRKWELDNGFITPEEYQQAMEAAETRSDKLDRVVAEESERARARRPVDEIVLDNHLTLEVAGRQLGDEVTTQQRYTTEANGETW